MPIIRKLFRELTDPTGLEAPRLDEIMEWTGAALNRVDRDKFFAKFKDAEKRYTTTTSRTRSLRPGQASVDL